MLVIKSKQFINELAKKYEYVQEGTTQYSDHELIDSYYYDPEYECFVACYNSNGDCFMEEYETIEELIEDNSNEDVNLLKSSLKCALKIILDKWIFRNETPSGLITLDYVLESEEYTLLETVRQLLKGGF